jgi:hypothetical protein
MPWLTAIQALPWKLIGFLGIVASAFIGGCHHGEVEVTKAWQAERVQTDNKLQQLAAKQATTTTQVVTQYVDRVQTVRVKGDDIIKEVKVYVPSAASTCNLSGGFRLLHDAAATQSELPDPARIADAPAAPAQDVASTVAENYATCHEVAEQLKALQSWVSQQEQNK